VREVDDEPGSAAQCHGEEDGSHEGWIGFDVVGLEP